tara:strand:- start:4361 stop:5512 length:1152 start_codon:yes stop_codon:yes gene_type:complete
MSYDAITIDTQVVYANDLELDSGLVGQLDQFKDGLVKFVISEINVREIHKALTEKAKSPLDSLSKTIKSGSGNNQLTDDQLKTLEAVKDGLKPPQEHARTQLSEFVANTGAEVVAADRAEMKSVLDKYFKNEPPFGSKGKKNEFPDAIALVSLEDWAKENNKKILAVSDDKDWVTFAEGSNYIDVVEDLAKAMALLNDLAEDTIPKAKSVLSAIKDENEDILAMLQARLEFAVESEFPYLEFDGPMPGEDEGASLSLVSYEIEGLNDDTTEIDVVRVGNGTFAFRVPAFITAKVYADISFSIRDSIDKDYVPMGSTSIEQETDFDAFLLIECSHFLNDPEDPESTVYEIEDVELLGAPDSIDIGYVDYSLADDDYEFDVESLQ